MISELIFTGLLRLQAKVTVDGDSGKPVIISFHLHPNCPEYDWPTEDLSELWKITQQYNVVALFHGHTHGSPPSRLLWDGKQFGSRLESGLPVFNPDDAFAAKTESSRFPFTNCTAITTDPKATRLLSMT